MTERVLIPQTERSVRYHSTECRRVDRGRAYEMAREDAEELLGRKPAPCVNQLDGDNGPDAMPPEVPA